MAVQYQFDGVWSALSAKATFVKNYASFLTENTTTTVAFPNPFNTTFAIGLDRESNEAVQVAITDLTGKVVESTTVEAANVSRIALGEELTPGIYTVTVKQGDFVENIKAIKTEK